ncbi:MAG: sugar phosphate isomerase/epimerase [Oligosphaeraceae bacterium]|nr:sugar phosphate isomerase/epimerase [Oligosphaeraceae bacterium]
MKIGVINSLRLDRQDCIFDRVRDMGFKTCQLSSWRPYELSDGLAEKVKAQIVSSGVQPCAFWAGYTGPIFWNFTEGPLTLGLVPPEYRFQRLNELKLAADFASKIGARAIITHCGFIPENMTDPEYKGTLIAIASAAAYCKQLGIGFWFETGQETPVVLLRVIEEIGGDNLGINLDPANLLMYGKGNPIDALDVFGKYVRNLHVKDGLVPTDGKKLGKEVQVGKGMVDFPRFMRKLRQIGFDGEFIIEREIAEGEEQKRDILETAENLQKWWNG